MSSEPKLFEPVVVTSTPESQESAYQKNLKRGEAFTKAWESKPYGGPFVELDLKGVWYCPHCREINRPLRLSGDELSMHCANPVQISLEGSCEYGYYSAEGLEKDQVFLTAGYMLPLSLEELIQCEIKDEERMLKNAKELIKNTRQRIKDLEQSLATKKEILKP